MKDIQLIVANILQILHSYIAFYNKNVTDIFKFIARSSLDSLLPEVTAFVKKVCTFYISLDRLILTMIIKISLYFFIILLSYKVFIKWFIESIFKNFRYHLVYS